MMTDEQQARIAEIRRQREEAEHERRMRQDSGREFLRRWVTGRFPIEWDRSSPRVAWNLVEGARFIQPDPETGFHGPPFAEVIRHFGLEDAEVVDWVDEVGPVTMLSNVMRAYETSPPFETLIISVEQNWLLEYPVRYAYEGFRICFGHGDEKWREWNMKQMP